MQQIETRVNQVTKTFEENMANVDRRVTEYKQEITRLLSQTGIQDTEGAIKKFDE